MACTYFMVPSVNSQSIQQKLLHFVQCARQNNLKCNTLSHSKWLFTPHTASSPCITNVSSVESIWAFLVYSSTKYWVWLACTRCSGKGRKVNARIKNNQGAGSYRACYMDIVRATLVSQLQYACRAWSGFRSAAECSLLQTIINIRLLEMDLFQQILHQPTNLSFNQSSVIQTCTHSLTYSLTRSTSWPSAGRRALHSSRSAAVSNAFHVVIPTSNSSWRMHMFLGRPRGRVLRNPPSPGAQSERQWTDEARCELEQCLRADEHVRTCPNKTSRRFRISVARSLDVFHRQLRHQWWNHANVSQECDADRTCERPQVYVRLVSTVSMFRHHTTELT